MHSARNRLFLLPLILLLTFASTTIQAKVLVFGVAPSLPKPVAELEDLRKLAIKKKSKFAVKQKKLDQQDHGFTRNTHKLPTKTEAWNQVLSFLSRKSGLELKYEPSTSQLDFELKLAKGYYDLAYTTPMQFHAFREFPGYQAQAKRKSQPIRGMIFVKKNGPISTLSELRGSTIAFPGLLDFAASVVPRESLSKLKFDVIPQFLPSQSAVYKGIAHGKYIAGGGTDESFRALPPEIRNSIRMLWDSPGFSPYPLIAHPRVDFFSLTKLKRALVNMVKDEEGKELLKYIFVDNGFEVAKNNDWDEISLIDLNVLNGSTKRTHAQ
jgi:ABC-type phosphate/phosphonate transport system substrate-binding protein